MSRFFKGPGTAQDSDLSSSDEESLYGSAASEDMGSDAEATDMSEDMSSSEEEVEEDESESGSEASAGADQGRNPYLRSQFLKGQGGSDSDSDSEDERKVVKSSKEKVLDEVDEEAEELDIARKAEDWVKAVTVFDRLVKVVERANRQYTLVPLSFVRAITEAQTAVAGKPAKKLSASQNRALNTLKQRVKRVERDFATRLEKYKEDPDNYVPGVPSLTQQTAAKSQSTSVGETSKPDITATEELSAATVFSTLVGIMESRGKKSTDRSEQVKVLEQLLQVADSPYKKISVLLMLIPIRFDLASSTSISSSSLYSGADFSQWEAIEADITTLFEVLENQKEYIIVESAPEAADIERGPEPGVNGICQIAGSLPILVERLDDEHARILATYDPHTTEYIEHLREETRVAALILRAQCHQERTLQLLSVPLHESESYCRLLSRRIDHLYYKPEAAIAATEVAAWARVPQELDSQLTPRATDVSSVNAIELITSLCSVLYKQPSTLLRARAMLSLIYQYALGDDYYKARDLMLMSHLQSSIHAMEPATQVLFNRSLVQVGLCAFRAGLISDALQSLQEICASSRLKELLGQGQARSVNQGDVPQVATQVQAPELLPYHMHINLELVECVYLTSSMLVEVPYLANLAGQRGSQADLKRRSQNRPFRRFLDVHDRQIFSGPSETTRDYVIQAAKRLQTGDWAGSLELLSNIKVWNLLSPAADTKERVLKMLEHRLKVEGLRTYLLTYGGQAYHSIGLHFLQEEFKLSEADTRQLLIKMIAGDEIAAMLDVSSEYAVFRPEADASRLQMVALALAEKAAQLSERNERLAADGHVPEQSTGKRPVRVRT